jgi:hypothetical protein
MVRKVFSAKIVSVIRLENKIIESEKKMDLVQKRYKSE